MRTPDVVRAEAAAVAIARSLGFGVEDAVVLHASNTLSLRLTPVDLVARVAPAEQQNAAFELDVAGQLAALGAPVVRPEPRLHERDGFVVTFWTYHAPAARYSAAAYADALNRLHAGMRRVEVDAPSVLERVGEAQGLVADRGRTPRLADADRAFLAETLTGFARRIGAADRAQLLHGEPHPGNLLATAEGPLFIDFETCCRGPVEFDVAHAPPKVAEHYPGLDLDLLQACRVLSLAVAGSWRWDVEDRLPDGPRLGREWLGQLRAEVSAYEASRR